jgi:hypothetical protein
MMRGGGSRALKYALAPDIQPVFFYDPLDLPPDLGRVIALLSARYATVFIALSYQPHSILAI